MRRQIFSTLSLSIAFIALAVGLSGQTNTAWWTGGGGPEDTNWSTGANWSGGVEPGAGYLVLFGYGDEDNVANAPQSIVVDVEDLEVWGISFPTEGNRSVSLSGNEIKMNGSPTLFMDPGEADVFINLDLRNTIGSGTGFSIQNDTSSDKLMTFGPNSTLFIPHGSSFYDIRGGSNTYVLQGIMASRAIRKWTASQLVIDPVDDTSIAINQINFNYNSNIETNKTALVFRNDTLMNVLSLSSNYSGDLAIARDSAEDIAVTLQRTITGGNVRSLVVLPGEEGEGHFTLRLHGLNSVPVYLPNDATLEFAIGPVTAADRYIRGGPNSVINGEGNVSIALDTAAQLIGSWGEMTHSGRTAVVTGILRMDTEVVGEDTFQGKLSPSSVLAIGELGTVRLNGIDQVIGGLEDGATDSSGLLQLQGASLTIAGNTATSFAGTIEDGGTLVIATSATQTLAGGYTHHVDRNLILQDGLLEIIGTADFSVGTLTMAGGRLAAATIDGSARQWDFSLESSNAFQQLVAATTIDLTGASLDLVLGDGFDPVLGDEFVLFYASDSILGVSTASILGYEDDQEFNLGGHTFRINLVQGSESIVLTVVPEPKTYAMLFGVVCLLAAMRWRKVK